MDSEHSSMESEQKANHSLHHVLNDTRDGRCRLTHTRLWIVNTRGPLGGPLWLLRHVPRREHCVPPPYGYGPWTLRDFKRARPGSVPIPPLLRCSWFASGSATCPTKRIRCLSSLSFSLSFSHSLSSHLSLSSHRYLSTSLSAVRTHAVGC